MALETTDFEDVLREAASEVTALDPDNLDTNEFRALRRSAKRRLEIAWEYHYWPVLGRVEQRFFKPDWDLDATYAAGDIVYLPVTQKYYQNLLDGDNGDEPDTNPAIWTEAETSYSADQWDSTVQYVQQDRVQYGDNVYQLYAATSTIGQPPTDTSKWGLLVPFDKYIPYEQTGQTAIGIVAAAWTASPRVTTRGTELNWSLSENGVQILSAVNFTWLDYRIRCPRLSGDLFSGTATYASGDQIYFSSASTPGNFYIANANTTAGQSPDTTAAKWDVVPLPRLFHKYLVYGMAADWLRGPGGGDINEWTRMEAEADACIQDQKTLLVGQQSQRVKTVVRTR